MRIPFFCLAAALLLMLSAQVEAHRYHFGLTELYVNARTQSLEISHRFFVADLERALALSAGTEFKNAQRQMEDYVNQRFQIRDGNGALLVPKWVGMEADVHDVWIYQEVPLANISGDKLEVRQSMLMEIEGDQVNTLNIKRNGKTESFTLKPGASRVTVSLR
ncbi:DUF6702 family protein [Microbulbifer sp. 2201CG32-9]|uniref:DUF6702 family protein n=1 Tax=Microbulbifer sp. 2201CG32-9 TaxID=3232309 RepID=UPI00345B823E